MPAHNSATPVGLLNLPTYDSFLQIPQQVPLPQRDLKNLLELLKDIKIGGFRVRPKKFKEPGTGSTFYGLQFTRKF